MRQEKIVIQQYALEREKKWPIGILTEPLNYVTPEVGYVVFKNEKNKFLEQVWVRWDGHISADDEKEEALYKAFAPYEEIEEARKRFKEMLDKVGLKEPIEGWQIAKLDNAAQIAKNMLEFCGVSSIPELIARRLYIEGWDFDVQLKYPPLGWGNHKELEWAIKKAERIAECYRKFGWEAVVGDAQEMAVYASGYWHVPVTVLSLGEYEQRIKDRLDESFA